MLKVNKDAHHTILNSGQQRVNIKKDVVFMFAASFVPQTEKRRKKAHILFPSPYDTTCQKPWFHPDSFVHFMGSHAGFDC